ncbi:hypothetical protein D8B26_006981 [Coccidioides posadasii str. Silveira]|uniref:Uncharacterized protein n=3 Tax=Coccidioides posadasii TaxID=199306 RepID=E9DGB4_COCPS|nr:GNAT family acetyltransferase, putative [Coccidioides posadasii C735 delta SOWgp]EER24789.1 GNAT family acetyltransferase, putative [Coccidioides posadasii C735 delta SOWgp]EFW14604.1 conserved hypothetical protein [Coccidioides posadasii str. Silveira]KMM68376.1 hypothetical protein CPAG_04705 [Coccidioides posadasii RMSCC 3488]QVM12351.1 hypothetical protein D8B26_006981 [Coccidioides posadasii str. Silveira]|eukprot:XP_003066934.1 GNAT family acetyltransferase, putative [Coccidioides posadasii C735 delta SOWgp]
MGDILPEVHFINKKGPEIRTPRLILRPLRDSDVGDMFAIRSREDVMVWSLTKLPDKDISATKKIMSRWNDETNVGLAVLEVSNPDRVCGVIGYNAVGNKMEVGYLMHPDVWGKGYATEALQASIEAWWNGYEAVKPKKSMMHELLAFTHEGNERSYRVLRKCGFEMVEELDDEYGRGNVWRLKRANSG